MIEKKIEKDLEDGLNMNEKAELSEEKDLKMIFELAKPISVLHQVLTHSTGNYFRLKLLQKLRKKTDTDKIQKFRDEAQLEESQRHLNKLLKFKLIKEAEGPENKAYERTDLGEEAVNAVKELQHKLGKKYAEKIFEASLGKNSIRLFIKVYEHDGEFSVDGGGKKRKIRYDPLEIGKISLFLPRSIEGLVAIDKLNLARLLYYSDDGYINFPQLKARAFFQYLKRLSNILPQA